MKSKKFRLLKILVEQEGFEHYSLIRTYQAQLKDGIVQKSIKVELLAIYIKPVFKF